MHITKSLHELASNKLQYACPCKIQIAGESEEGNGRANHFVPSKEKS
jgi:two-component sensor histidine kinase